MKPTPLLEMWQKPSGAGDAVGVLATSFTFEPDFFERDCLSRFLAVESVDEGTGSTEDLVARLELEEALAAPIVTVLADRSAQSERSTLRWDLLHCRVDKGLLHSKVAVLLWENATRVIVGSANLTPAGYRFNIELAMAADLGNECLFPREVLGSIADELQSYLDLVPGLDPEVPARRRAVRLLQLLRQRIDQQPHVRSKLLVTSAPTNATTQPLDQLSKIWHGAQPLQATHVSPFWDSGDATVLREVSKLLKGRPADERWHGVAVTVGPSGEISFPIERLKDGDVDEVVQLKPLGEELRALHAKCLVIESKQWIAALVGSSNHTKAGLGLGGFRRHREFNVWLGAPLDSQEGKSLYELIQFGDKKIGTESPYEAEEDEDEVDDLVVLPSFFQLCRLSRQDEGWWLTLSFDPVVSPKEWQVSLPNRDIVIGHQEWKESGGPDQCTRAIKIDGVPMFLDVEWDGCSAAWSVVVDDRNELPPGLGLKDLRSSQLLDALASGRSLAQLLRDQFERVAIARSAGKDGGIITDPLRRFDSQSTLLRRGRALASALAALERRLCKPVATLEAMEARLSGPLGPQFIASKVVAEFFEGSLSTSEVLFTLAEISLSISRVSWREAFQRVNFVDGIEMVGSTLDKIDVLREQVGHEVTEMGLYVLRAVKEAKRCLAC